MSERLKMERIIRPFDPDYDADLIAHAAPAEPVVVETVNQRWAHRSWVAAMGVSCYLVYFAFVSPALNTHILAQPPIIVSDGRMVRQEEKLENLLATVGTHTTKIELQGAEIIRLTAELEGAEKAIKFGGGLIMLLNGVAVWFSRKK